MGKEDRSGQKIKFVGEVKVLRLRKKTGLTNSVDFRGDCLFFSYVLAIEFRT